MKLTLGNAHELGLCASLTTSILIVMLGGEFPPWVWLAAFAPLLSMMMRRRGFEVPGSSGTLLGLAAVGAGVGSLLRGGIENAVFAGGATLIGVMAARVLTRKTLAHDFQSIALSLVLVLAGSILNVGLSYILVFVAYAISTVWALATRQLIAGAAQTGASEQKTKARDDVITPLFFLGSGLVSLGVLTAAVVVFLSFPRIGFGELGFLLSKESRLPSTVGFGGDPRGLSTSTDVVARVRNVPMERFEKGLYLRGIVYDTITLDAFSQSPPDATEAPVADQRPSLTSLARQPGKGERYEVMLNPLGGDLLFVLGGARVVQGISGGAANPNRSVPIGGRDRHDEMKAAQRLASAIRYAVTGDIAAPGELPPPPDAPKILAERERYLQVPPSTPAVEAALQEALGPAPASLDELQKVTRLREWFLTRFRYSLEGEVTNRDHALDAFLGDVRAGHCELFAGGFALLLRRVGIPARVIGGYQGGALADDGSIVFESRHAHAWVEWWRDGHGWIVDDATPENAQQREALTGFARFVDQLRRVWDDKVLDYSLGDQQEALQGVASVVRGKNLGKLAKAAIMGGGVWIVGVLLVRRFLGGRRRRQLADRLAVEILAAADRLKEEPHAATATLREVIAGLSPPVLRRAVDVYERARFGGVSADDDEMLRLLQALKALKGAASKKD